MALLELCLMTLLSPPPAAQGPAASPAPVASTAAPQDPSAGTDAIALARAERSGKPVPVAELVAFTGSADAAVATRAAWLLGKQKDPQALPALASAATTSAVAGVRLQAMAALLRQGSPRSVDAAIRGLDDGDPQVRTIAAQLLGRLRNAAGRGPLLALLDRRAKADGPAVPTTDLQAAILALNDMEATEQLLPAATALHDSEASGCGQALTFYFQNLSPKLAADDETTLLLSVLDHREVMLRRYAISRLGELEDPSTAAALQRRLGVEGPELRPLLEVAIARVQNQQHGAPAAAAAATDLPSALRQRWEAMSAAQRLATAGGGGLLLVAVGALAIAWRRRRAAVLAGATPSAIDLVAPSDEYLQAEAAAEATAAAGDDVVDVDAVPGVFAADDAAWQPVGGSDETDAGDPPRS